MRSCRNVHRRRYGTKYEFSDLVHFFRVKIRRAEILVFSCVPGNTFCICASVNYVVS